LLGKENKKNGILFTAYLDSSFVKMGVQKDVEILNNDHSIAWTHRKIGYDDVYFISNQKDREQIAGLSFRIAGKMPEIWNTLDPEKKWKRLGTEKGRIKLYIEMQPSESVFIVFRKSARQYVSRLTTSKSYFTNINLVDWNLQFNEKYGSNELIKEPGRLKSWTENKDSMIKFYSGTATYSNTFLVENIERIHLASIYLDSVCNIATVKINGIDCGTIWTKPYELDIKKALKQGENKIEIEVTNTWHNRLIGDNLLLPEKRLTFTTAPFRLKDKPLLPAGIIGEVKIIIR